MTPSDINVLIHYYAFSGPHDRVDAPAVREAITTFIERGLMVRDQNGNISVTEGGRVLVQALCAVPFPVQKWQMPDGDTEWYKWADGSVRPMREPAMSYPGVPEPVDAHIRAIAAGKDRKALFDAFVKEFTTEMYRRFS